MKLIHMLKQLHLGHTETVARWGRAELIRRRDGRYELRGGAPEERQAAREWVSLFLHEAVVTP